jgi:sulfate transport system ATP-binding protein
MSIEVKNIGKHFGNFVALNNVSLEFATGELTALLGPSGCGKTTLLRVIAGLEQADQGQVILDGEDASVRHVRERQVGFVFQHYALFKHMSVFENIAFGLRVKPRASRPSEAQIREKVMRLLSLVQLDWLADRYPSQLSGGQRQRIALARALAVEPRVLLLDDEALPVRETVCVAESVGLLELVREPLPELDNVRDSVDVAVAEPEPLLARLGAWVDLAAPVMGLGASAGPVRLQMPDSWGALARLPTVNVTTGDGRLYQLEGPTGCAVVTERGPHTPNPERDSGASYATLVDLGAASDFPFEP